MNLGRLFKFSKKKKLADNHHQLDQQIVFRLSKSRLPGWRQWRYLPKFLSNTEKMVIIGCLLILISSLGVLINHYYKNNWQVSPKIGGYYVEGLIGTPRYINPLYSSINQTDRDLSRLIYSSLLTRDSLGKLTNDLAESYQVSPDGLVYTIKLRDNVLWSNGNKLTAEDVVFTYNAIIDSAYGSPLFNSLNGVEITKLDDLTIKFTLGQSYNAFLDLLTIGIMPAELWGQVPAESASLADLNLKPIGSGPYQFKSLTKDRAGTIKSYQLAINPNYFGQKPYIEELTFKFFANYDELVAALNDGSIDGATYLPQITAQKLLTTSRYKLNYFNTPQLVGVFINENDTLLKNTKIRQALALALDKNQLLLQNNNLVSRLAAGPILKNNQYYDKDLPRWDFDTAKAAQLLLDDGWQLKTITEDDLTKAKQDLEQETNDNSQAKLIAELGIGQWLQKNNQYLALNLTVVNEPDYIATAEWLQQSWKKIGININLDIIDPEDINKQIIRQKSYSLLVYGQNLGSENDLTALWHSSQSGPSGFNLSNYRNEKVDKALETLRTSTDQAGRQQAAKDLQTQINTDLPGIFLYNSSHLYIQNKKIKGLATDFIIEPADRFNDIENWYIKTKINWKK
ncbi:MAG TPA: ABC transporter substrate-binding protein [bacterium]|nr:ABC transporter substrate-binding protein [bacterium]